MTMVAVCPICCDEGRMDSHREKARMDRASAASTRDP